MRKWLTPLLLLTLLIAGAPARAYDFSYVTVENQTIYFRIVDSNAVVTYPTADDRQDWYEYTRPVGTVTIPQTVEHNGTTYTVTAIGHDAFFHCYQLTNVILPSTVTSIGERAFQRCAFRTLTLPSTVTYIGPRAFNSNDAMTEFTAEGVVTLDNGVFDYCLSLRTVNLGTHVTSIGHNAFRWCRDLTSITISDATTTIGDSAFVHCTSLRNVSFGTGVTSIGISAFRGCISLQSITLPTNLTAISDSLFARCTNLNSVNFGNNNIVSIGQRAFYRCYALASVTLPESLAVVGDYAFSYCPLTSVAIPDGVTTIGENAFMECRSLGSVTFGSGVKRIKKSAFYYCNSLQSATLPNSLRYLGEQAFANCTALTAVDFGTSIDTIDMYAFSGCTSLTSVTIPASVKMLGTKPFDGCTGLTSARCLAANPPYCGGYLYPFDSCANLPKVLVPINSIKLYKEAEGWNKREYDLGVIMEDGQSYTMSGNRIFYPIPVEYSRTFTSTNWQALFVPFSVSYEQWHNYGSVARLAEVTENAEGETVFVWEYLQTTEWICAGMPYIFKPRNTGATTMTFTADTLEWKGHITNKVFECRDNSTNALKNTFTLKGIYQPMTYGDSIAPSIWYALAGGNFQQAGEGATLLPCRFYMTVTDDQGILTTLTKSISNTINGEEVDIEFVVPEVPQRALDNNYYDLLGRRVESPLPGKVYIHQGKKIMFTL